MVVTTPLVGGDDEDGRSDTLAGTMPIAPAHGCR